MAELGADLDGTAADSAETGADLSKTVSPAPAGTPPDAGAALSVWRQKEATRMSDPSEPKTGTTSVTVGLPSVIVPVLSNTTVLI